jgi:hypothetical protein
MRLANSRGQEERSGTSLLVSQYPLQPEGQEGIAALRSLPSHAPGLTNVCGHPNVLEVRRLLRRRRQFIIVQLQSLVRKFGSYATSTSAPSGSVTYAE